MDQKNENSRIQTVRSLLIAYAKHLIGFFILFYAVRLSCCVGWYNIIYSSELWYEFCKILSITCGVVAVSGNRGWEIQTWSEDTDVEQLNNRIILGLAFISGFLALFL